MYIDYWPELLNDLSGEILSALDKENSSKKLTVLQLPLHKLCKYLHGLAHKLSVYYKHCHILPPCSSSKVPPQLLPKLWPRLYLLKALQFVMDECFYLLEIKPPTVM